MFETLRADELIPGDTFNTHCGVGDLAWCEILSVTVLENDNPGMQDRIEIRYRSNGICNVRVFLADSRVDIKA